MSTLLLADFDFEIISSMPIAEEVIETGSFYEYVSDDKIAFFYKNCFAVIIPTIVGTYTYPHIEGFYFKKLVFYTTS